MLDRPSHFWETYIVYWAMSGIHESSVFNIIYRIASRIYNDNNRELSNAEPIETDIKACINALSPLATLCRIDRWDVWQGSWYKEDHFDFHLMPAAAYLDDVSLVTQLLNQGVDASRYGGVFGPPSRAAALARNCNIVGFLSSSQSKNGQAAQDIQVAAIKGAFMGDHLNALKKLYLVFHSWL